MSTVRSARGVSADGSRGKAMVNLRLSLVVYGQVLGFERSMDGLGDRFRHPLVATSVEIGKRKMRRHLQ